MAILTNRFRGLKAVWRFDNRLQLILNRTLFRGTGLTVYKLAGREIVVDHHGGDESGTRLCLTSNMYRKYLSRMRLPSSISVLDLGANGGGFPLMLAVEGIPIRKLVCVELNPQTFTRLQLNVCRNIAGDCKVVNAAVCGERRPFELVLGLGGTADSIFQGGAGGASAGRTYTVQGVTLDDIEREEFHGEAVVDICKMDVERAEYEIFSSSTNSLVKKFRYLIIEIHETPGRDERQLVGAIEGLGFAVVDVPRDPGDVGDDQNVYLFQNTNIT